MDEGRETPARGSDFLQLAVADVPAGGKAEWLTGRLRQAMADGRLPVGSRLPPTRVLAAELRVSRGVVTEAYRRLAEDGQVAGRRRGGTVVLATPFPSAVPPGAGDGDGSPGAGEEGVNGRPGGAGGDLDARSAWERGDGAGGAYAGRGGGAAHGARTARDDEPCAGRRGGEPEGTLAGRDGGTTGPDSRPRSGQAHGPDAGRNGEPDGGRPRRPDTGRHPDEPDEACTGRSGGSAEPDSRPHSGQAHGPDAGRNGEPDGGRPRRPDTGRHPDEPDEACTGRSGGSAEPDSRPHSGQAHGPDAGRNGGAVFGGVLGAGVFDVLRAAPADVDFTPGRPDLSTFPRAAWLRAERAVLAGLSADQLGYGDPRGAPPLRRAVADWLARVRGVRAEPDAVLVVAGTAQALTLLHPVLRADGVDAVAVEDPGSLGARQHLGNGGLATPPVPVDEEGVRVDALRATGARAVLLTPAHQFPTGVVTSGERRRELLAWARGGGLILEDDYDAEHRYDRPPVPALRALLADRVCYMGSVSKLLAPALRIGWLVAPARHRAALVDAKRFNDLGNAVLPQLVLARLMESGELERHLRLVRGRHRRRRDAMIAALAEHLPGARVHGAAAGLHLTVTYAADVPDTEFAAAALARGVKCQPLSWHRQRPGPPGLVLGYAATPPGVVADGVAVLGRTLRELGGPAAVRLRPPLPGGSPGPRSGRRRWPS